MKVSVLMAVYDGEAYVEEAIASVRAQTHRDLEFVVVDDGSTDATPTILARHAGEDPRIRILRQDNRGAAAARTHGLHEASCEWVFLLDADDLMLPERIARQLAFIHAHPGVRVASCRARYISADGRILGRTKLEPFTDRASFEAFLASGEAIALCHPTVALHRATALEQGGYRAQFHGAEDSDLWNRIAEAGHMVLMQDEVLVHTRLHAASTVTRDFRKNRLQHDWMRACMAARRAGRPEPDFESFLATLARAPWPARLDRERKLLAKAHYRAAALLIGERRRLTALARLGLAALLQPSYVLPRLRAQLGRGDAEPGA